jgi:hypothetical protein
VVSTQSTTRYKMLVFFFFFFFMKNELLLDVTGQCSFLLRELQPLTKFIERNRGSNTSREKNEGRRRNVVVERGYEVGSTR